MHGTHFYWFLAAMESQPGSKISEHLPKTTSRLESTARKSSSAKKWAAAKMGEPQKSFQTLKNCGNKLLFFRKQIGVLREIEIFQRLHSRTGRGK